MQGVYSAFIMALRLEFLNPNGILTFAFAQYNSQ